jgi:type IV pilus assembly protein PilA
MIQQRIRSSGFTLIELLVVISIIGMLASVIMASFGGARDSAQDTRLMSDIHQLDIAMNAYFNDHNDYPIVVRTLPNYGQMPITQLVDLLKNEGYLGGDLFQNDKDRLSFYSHRCGESQVCKCDPSNCINPLGPIKDAIMNFLPCGTSYTFDTRVHEEDSNPNNDDDNSDEITTQRTCSGNANSENSGCLQDAKALILFQFRRPQSSYRYFFSDAYALKCFY